MNPEVEDEYSYRVCVTLELQYEISGAKAHSVCNPSATVTVL